VLEEETVGWAQPVLEVGWVKLVPEEEIQGWVELEFDVW
jgi:hypothetical protein